MSLGTARGGTAHALDIRTTAGDTQQEVFSSILVNASGNVRPSIKTPPIIHSGSRWEGFEYGELLLSPASFPPSSSLLCHVVGIVGDCTPGTAVHWRERGLDCAVDLRDGDVLIRSQQELEHLEWTDRFHVSILGVEKSRMIEIADGSLKPSDCELIPRFGGQDPSLSALIDRLHEHASEGFPEGTLYGECLAQIIAIHSLKVYGKSRFRIHRCRTGLATPVLLRLLDFMQSHLHANIGLRELARFAGMTPRELSERFPISVGVPIHRFHLGLRLGAARTLVEEGTLSLVEIAHRTGFSDQTHFTRVFRRRFAVTPGQLRQVLSGKRCLWI